VGTPLQTIQKTSKRLKGWKAAWASMSILGLSCSLVDIHSGEWLRIGLLLISIGTVALTWIKVRIWWHHG